MHPDGSIHIVLAAQKARLHNVEETAMNRFRHVVALTLALAVLTVGSRPAQAMIGGQLDTEGRYPNVAAIGVVTEGVFFRLCSGTLIMPRVIATAGHCAFFLPLVEADGYDVVVTFDALPSATSTVFDAVAFYVHPDYVDPLRGISKCGLFGWCTDDFGIAVLAEEVVGITPASLPPIGLTDQLDLKTESFIVAGYGLEGFHPAHHPFLIGQVSGRRKFAEFRAIPANDVTSGLFLKLMAADPHTGICYGDSGSPVFYGATVVANSTIVPSEVCASTSYHARYDTASFQNWLNELLADLGID